MQCPVCDDIRLKEIEKNGVLIDICPGCKGVWLDRGELDKLMGGVREMQHEYERYTSEPMHASESPMQHQPKPSSYRTTGYASSDKTHSGYGHDYPSGYSKSSYPYGYKKKKKKTVLDTMSDLFDF
ncbi:TFIIB-type zinc ribbon-containing protein [Marinicrinis sediminis]|uniref:Zf-TFIIB domain-containing protein n=1 Tax=Marinicrinis sediminis TaxID=1652465 RepID=A0ABW5RDK4_9BACL